MNRLLLGLLGGLVLSAVASSAFAVTINAVTVSATPFTGAGTSSSTALPAGATWAADTDPNGPFIPPGESGPLTTAVGAANHVTGVPLGGTSTTGGAFTLSVNGLSGAPATATHGTSGSSEDPFSSGSNPFFLVGPGFSDNGSTSDPALLMLSGVSNVFSLLWGSIDSWNVLYFLDNGVVTDVVSGADAKLGGLPSGATGASMVTITGLQNYNEVLFASYGNVPSGFSGNAFEFADISTVPLPATALLLLSALGGLGLMAWRRQRPSTLALAA